MCYICFEPCSDLSKCACVNQYAHLSCLFRFASERRDITCTVCKTPIDGFKVEKKTHRQPSTNSVALASGCVSFSGLLASAFVVLYTSYNSNLALAVSLGMFAFSILGLVFCLRGLFYWGVRHEPLIVRRVATRIIAQTVSQEAAACPEAAEAGVELAPV